MQLRTRLRLYRKKVLGSILPTFKSSSSWSRTLGWGNQSAKGARRSTITIRSRTRHAKSIWVWTCGRWSRSCGPDCSLRGAGEEQPNEAARSGRQTAQRRCRSFEGMLTLGLRRWMGLNGQMCLWTLPTLLLTANYAIHSSEHIYKVY
jgi:hypothetical protein